MKAARLASWHYSRLLVTSASEEGASKQRGPLGMRDAAASPLLPSIHRYYVFGSLAFLLLSVVRVSMLARALIQTRSSYLLDQLIAGFRNNDSQ